MWPHILLKVLINGHRLEEPGLHRGPQRDNKSQIKEGINKGESSTKGFRVYKSVEMQHYQTDMCSHLKKKPKQNKWNYFYKLFLTSGKDHYTNCESWLREFMIHDSWRTAHADFVKLHKPAAALKHNKYGLAWFKTQYFNCVISSQIEI